MGTARQAAGVNSWPQSLRDEFSHLFGPTTTDMRSFFSQQDKVGVINFTLNALGLMT